VTWLQHVIAAAALFGQIAAGCSETSPTHRDGPGLAGGPAPLQKGWPARGDNRAGRVQHGGGWGARAGHKSTRSVFRVLRWFGL